MSAVTSSTTSNEAYRSQVAQKRADQQMSSLSRSLKASENIGKAVGVDTSAVQAASKKIAEPVSSTKVSLSTEAVSKLKAEEAQKAGSTANSTSTTAATASSSAAKSSKKQQFKSVDEAIAYGASKATEQSQKRVAGDKATQVNSASVGATSTAASNAKGAESSASVKAAKATATSASTTSSVAKSENKAKADLASEAKSESNASVSGGVKSAKKQFKSVDEAIAYGAAKANEQVQAKKKAAESSAAGSQVTAYSAQKAVEQYGKVASA